MTDTGWSSANPARAICWPTIPSAKDRITAKTGAHRSAETRVVVTSVTDRINAASIAKRVEQDAAVGVGEAATPGPA